MALISALCQCIPKSLSRNVLQTAFRPLRLWSQSAFPATKYRLYHSLGVLSSPLLLPPSVLVAPNAGMKQMGKLRRRCKHCFFIMIDERLHVWCDVHPRHKQMQMVPKPKTVIRTTHATQGRIRPW